MLEHDGERLERLAPILGVVSTSGPVDQDEGAFERRERTPPPRRPPARTESAANKRGREEREQKRRTERERGEQRGPGPVGSVRRLEARHERALRAGTRVRIERLQRAVLMRETTSTMGKRLLSSTGVLPSFSS